MLKGPYTHTHPQYTLYTHCYFLFIYFYSLLYACIYVVPWCSCEAQCFLYVHTFSGMTIKLNLNLKRDQTGMSRKNRIRKWCKLKFTSPTKACMFTGHNFEYFLKIRPQWGILKPASFFCFLFGAPPFYLGTNPTRHFYSTQLPIYFPVSPPQPNSALTTIQ